MSAVERVEFVSDRISPCIDEITGGHPCGFQHNRSTTDQISCICYILGKKLLYHETVQQYLKKVHDSARRKVLCNILIESGVPMKLGRLINVFKWNIKDEGV
jgi:hypothetical protein